MLFNPLLDRPHAQILWDYNHLRQPLRAADFIFIMCSYNLEVADYASILLMQKKGEFIVVSGGQAHQTDMLRTGWDEPEAHVFQERLLELGVAKNQIIVEDKSTNSGENVLFTKELLKDRDPALTSGLIVQKPYMERRAYATACQQWSDMDWEVTSPNVTYEDYIDKFDEERLINIMVGDTWRVKDYADKGYQIPQDMPDDVEKSLKVLMDKGYTKHIPKD